jgi:hypothetical protein
MSVLPVKTDMAWTNVLTQTMATNPPTPPQESSLQAMTTDQPRMLPPQFGFQAKMDRIDRRLFEFCTSVVYVPVKGHTIPCWVCRASSHELITDTKNWCPGRSILNHTNLWLRDLAPMHKNEGILYAIQSLAGVYIYDYLPDELIRQRINERYVMADEYFSKLLVAPESRRIGGGDEVITMAVILSMQDVRVTANRCRMIALRQHLVVTRSDSHLDCPDRAAAQETLLPSLVGRVQTRRVLPPQNRSRLPILERPQRPI